MKKSENMVKKTITVTVVEIIALLIVAAHITFILTLIFVLAFHSGLRLYESEYFIYSVSYDEPVASIYGLTDKGKEQEYLVIPQYINGKKVTSIGCSSGLEPNKITEKYGDVSYSQFQSEKLKKVFVVSDIKITARGWCPYDLCDNAPAFEALLYIPNNDISTPLNVTGDGTNVYRTNASKVSSNAANVSYFYNYENAPNDNYYWIDNCKYGSRIEYIPGPPKRGGYTFGGWYQESECVREWNFETDTLPEAQLDEDNREIYRETKLYAKWIKD